MQLLKYFDCFNKYYDVEKNKMVESELNLNIYGWCMFIDKTFSALFVREDKMYFLFANKEYPIDKCLTAEIDRQYSNKCNLFRLSKDNRQILQFLYEKPEVDIGGISPFEYIDEEDYDWGAFLYSIISDESKRERIIELLHDK